MARTKFHLGQITLSNQQTNATIIPIDTAEEGIIIGNGTGVAGEFIIDWSSGDIKIDANGTGSNIDIDADAGITIDNNTSGDIDIIQNSSGNRILMLSEGGLEIVKEGLDSSMFIVSSGNTGGWGLTIENQNAGILRMWNVASTDGGIDIDNRNNGGIDIKNNAGRIFLSPGNGTSVEILKSQKRTVKSIINTDSPYTVADEYYVMANPSAGNIVINLPAASGNSGLVYKIKNSDTALTGNTVTVDGDGTETIDGNTTIVLNDLEAIEVVCDGTQWLIV